MHEDESAERLNHSAHVPARAVVRGNRSADRNSAVLCYLRGDITDPANINVAVFLRETKLGGEMLTHKVAIQKCNRSTSHFEELDHQHIGDSRLARTG